MRIESKLCHIAENKVVVQVSGWLKDENLGSALAEASSVELAEDKAISRLNKRLNIINSEPSKNINKKDIIKDTLKLELPKSEKIEDNNEVEEPFDWSNELTEIDSEIKRLNWKREDEVRFLEENLGYNHRNKITKYDELIKYLNILKKIDNTDSSKLKRIDRKSIIDESDSIIKDLSWNNKQGREFLQNEFNVSTRIELDDDQLLSFIEKLKSIRNQSFSL